MEEMDEFDDLCPEPLEVTTHGPAVILSGPDGVALAMTKDAAKISAQRLIEAVATLERPK